MRKQIIKCICLGQKMDIINKLYKITASRTHVATPKSNWTYDLNLYNF